MRLKPTVNALTCRIAVVTWAMTPTWVTAERVAGGNSTRTMRMWSALLFDGQGADAWRSGLPLMELS